MRARDQPGQTGRMSAIPAVATVTPWTAHDTRLILCAAAAVALVVLLVVRVRLHAFPALMVGSLLMGLAAGEATNRVATSFETGVGGVLGNVGVVLALGTMLGRLLADSGGADRIAETLVSRSGRGAAPWAMALIAMLIGIPLFFEIGVVLLIPVIFTVARRLEAEYGSGGAAGAHNTYLLVGLPALAGLSVLHGLIPPHPGPLIAIAAVKASLGTHPPLRADRRRPHGDHLRAALRHARRALGDGASARAPGRADDPRDPGRERRPGSR